MKASHKNNNNKTAARFGGVNVYLAQKEWFGTDVQFLDLFYLLIFFRLYLIYFTNLPPR